MIQRFRKNTDFIVGGEIPRIQTFPFKNHGQRSSSLLCTKITKYNTIHYRKSLVKSKKWWEYVIGQM